MLGAALGIGGALLGAIAGAQGDRSEQTYGKNLGMMDDIEKYGGDSSLKNLKQLQSLMNQGPGAQDVKAGLQSQRGLASLLQQMLSSGGLPNQQQMGYANQFTNDVFAPEQNALQQRFNDASMFANQQAARMGRSGNDPILMNKLLQEQTRQQAQLGSQMTSFRSQFAQQMPQQQIGLAQSLAQVQGGLASQAMANRQALFNMGNQLKSQQQNFRLGAASTTMNSQTGGGMMGGLSGLVGGLGAGLGVYKGLGDAGFFGGSDPAMGAMSGGGGAAPSGGLGIRPQSGF